MEYDAGEMMPGGIETKEGDVKRVTEPGYRVPVACFKGGEHPCE